MNDRLGGIAAFVQAVEAGSFAQAADRMNLTLSPMQPSQGSAWHAFRVGCCPTM
jgi:hypothetical protein